MPLIMSSHQISSTEPSKIMRFEMEVGLHHKAGITRANIFLYLTKLFHATQSVFWAGFLNAQKVYILIFFDYFNNFNFFQHRDKYFKFNNFCNHYLRNIIKTGLVGKGVKSSVFYVTAICLPQKKLFSRPLKIGQFPAVIKV